MEKGKTEIKKLREKLKLKDNISDRKVKRLIVLINDLGGKEKDAIKRVEMALKRDPKRVFSRLNGYEYKAKEDFLAYCKNLKSAWVLIILEIRLYFNK